MEKEETSHLPTIKSSLSEAFVLILLQRSMVKSVAAELKIEVKDDMMADSITAIRRPRRPGRNTECKESRTI